MRPEAPFEWVSTEEYARLWHLLDSGPGFLPDYPPDWLRKEQEGEFGFFSLFNLFTCLRGPIHRELKQPIDSMPIFIITQRSTQIQRIDDIHFILCHALKYDSKYYSRIKLTLFNLNDLNPLINIPDEKELKESIDRLRFNGKSVSEIEFPLTFDAKSESYQFPDSLRISPEIILRIDPPNESYIVLYCFDFLNNKFDILPLKWYAGVDHLYEELIRFKRDPRDGNIIALGFRLFDARIDGKTGELLNWFEKGNIKQQLKKGNFKGYYNHPFS